MILSWQSSESGQNSRAVTDIGSGGEREKRNPGRRKASMWERSDHEDEGMTPHGIVTAFGTFNSGFLQHVSTTRLDAEAWARHHLADSPEVEIKRMTFYPAPDPPELSEGTTPQAERPTAEYRPFTSDIENLRPPRAVAPVETLEKSFSPTEWQRNMALGALPVEARLSASCPWCKTDALEAAKHHEGPHATWCPHFREGQRGGELAQVQQFWNQWVKEKGWGHSLISSRIVEFAEAFRDKSEVELRAKLAAAERYGKTEFGIEQILRKDLEEANNLRRAAEAEVAALRELLAEYGTGEWDDSDFDKWIDKKDKLLKAFVRSPGAPVNCQYCGEKTIPYRQYAYALLANLPLELGLKLAVIVDAEVSRDKRKCFCAERPKEAKS